MFPLPVVLTVLLYCLPPGLLKFTVDAREFTEKKTCLIKIKIEWGELDQENVANADGSCSFGG